MGLEVDCARVESFINADLVLEINKFITEPESFEAEGYLRAVTESNELVDRGREEDHHEKLSFGIVESLIEIILPKICDNESRDVLWLTSKLMAELASSQAFFEGNKRTAYLAGAMFLVNVQKDQGFDRTVIPILNDEFVEILQDVAIEKEDHVFIYEYMRDGIGDSLKKLEKG